MAQIRFQAELLRTTRKISLPNSTPKHTDLLFQWFVIHWVELAEDMQLGIPDFPGDIGVGKSKIGG
jgi:hypothetical protein